MTTLIEAGQVWTHKGNGARAVAVEEVRGEYVYVRRNTSRRKQPIRQDTLRREYRLARMA